MSNAAKFEEYHEANPRVFERMATEAMDWKRAGHGKLGVGMLVAHIRWIGAVEKWGDFKINENHGAYYARLMQIEYPELVGMFEMRASEADEWVVQKYPGSPLADQIITDRARRDEETIRWNRKATTR